VEGGNLSMIELIHCKNFCKSHSVPPAQHNNTGKKKRIKKRKKERERKKRKDQVDDYKHLAI
jgi:hypothetical protein